MRAWGSARVCSGAPARGCGSGGAGARRELGLGRLQLPSVPASSSLPGTSATARHQAGPGRMGKLERT